MPKGRDKELVKMRNEALCRRYYYWTEVRRLRFDDTIRLLSRQEFFISEERVMAVIRQEASGKGSPAPPVPKVRFPKLTARQLSLFTEE